jgi:hypothetical protein
MASKILFILENKYGPWAKPLMCFGGHSEYWGGGEEHHNFTVILHHKHKCVFYKQYYRYYDIPHEVQVV